MNKYPTFSPNACNPVSTSECQCDLTGHGDEVFCRTTGASFCLIAGDAKTALYVHLKNVRCTEGASEEDPSTWKSVNIAGYKFITLYAREINKHDNRFVLHGYPVAPLKNGNVVFLFHSGVLDCVSGEWEGEVEIEYKNGRIITAIEWVKFLINEDFSGHGSTEGHSTCGERPDHLPEIPGIQQLPNFPLDPSLDPDIPIGVIPDPLTTIMRTTLQRHGVIK